MILRREGLCQVSGHVDPVLLKISTRYRVAGSCCCGWVDGGGVLGQVRRGTGSSAMGCVLAPLLLLLLLFSMFFRRGTACGRETLPR